MAKEDQILDDLNSSEYKYGFVSDIESDTLPKGLSEDTIRFISTKKQEHEFMLKWRLKAYKYWFLQTCLHEELM